MADFEKINSLIETARENYPAVRYNHKMLEFLILQMEKLENVGDLVQKRRKRGQVEGSSHWRNLYRVLERGELLIRRHAEPFDLQKFYKVATVEEGVKDLCGGLRNCVEELVMDGSLPQGKITIKYHLEEERAKEDRTYMYWYLAYILEGKHSSLQLPEETQKEWDGLKSEHEGRMERLLLIGDSDRDKIQWGKPIGTGGNAQVFAARWRDIDVAVKKLADSERHLSHEALASFFTEVEIQMGMNYPFVVRLYAVSRTGLMLMELATSNLAVVYQQEMSMSWSLKAKLLAQAAQGLEYVHDRGVVHRDVKSLNFLVFGNSSENYTVKVADFGLAYMKTETRSKTGRQLGSPLWMAPEVHEGKFHSFNSDVFSFGVVMFEVAAQMLPYRGATPEVLLGRKRRKRDPCVVPEDCPEDLLKLMRSCIVPDPQQRPKMKDIATKLNDIQRQCQGGCSPRSLERRLDASTADNSRDVPVDVEQQGSRAQRRALPGSSHTSKRLSWFTRRRVTESSVQAPSSPAARTPSPRHRRNDTDASNRSSVPSGSRDFHAAPRGQRPASRDGRSGSSNVRTGSYEPRSGSYEPRSGTYEPRLGTYEPRSGTYEPRSGTYKPRSGAYEPRSGSYNVRPGSRENRPGSYNVRPGFYDPRVGPYEPVSGSYEGQSGSYAEHSVSYEVPDEERNYSITFHHDLANLYTDGDGTDKSLQSYIGTDKSLPSYMRDEVSDLKPPIPVPGSGTRIRRSSNSTSGREGNSRDMNSRDSRGSNGSSLQRSVSGSRTDYQTELTMSASTEEWIRSKENELKRTQDDRRTLLHKAAEEGNVEAAEVLVHHVENIDNIDKLGWTPLHDASREGRSDIVRLILASGANPSIQDIGGETPLHLAAYHNHVDVVGLLLSHAADHGLKNNWGNTALHVACMRQNIDVVATLLDNGANPWLKNKNGKLAQALGGASIAELFRGVSESGRHSPNDGRKRTGLRRFFGKGSQ